MVDLETRAAPMGFGIVGTGFIAGIIANALEKSEYGRLVAVASRSQERADTFAAQRTDVVAVAGVDALLAHGAVEAVYVATPTAVQEEPALAAIRAGRHVLVDKPFTDAGEVERLSAAATEHGVAFLDATHFVHHPRTDEIQDLMDELIGTPRSLHTAFHVPYPDRDNIRLDPSLEPTGALGDMAWYSLRAVVEYLEPDGVPTHVAATIDRDPQTGAAVRVGGFLAFADGRAATFDAGYTAGTVVQELQLLGTDGIVTMDDFVLDWHTGFGRANDQVRTGYVHRRGMASRDAFDFRATPSDRPAAVRLVDRLVHMARTPDPADQARRTAATLATQRLVDLMWDSAFQDCASR